MALDTLEGIEEIGMTKYLIKIPWKCTFLARVEAKNEDDALEKSYECSPILCDQCGNKIRLNGPDDYYQLEPDEINE